MLRVRVLLLALVCVAATSCASTGRSDPPSDPRSDRPEVSDLELVLTLRAEAGSLDQTLEVTNRAGRAVVLRGRLEALDSAGQPLPGVAVTTAFGTELGRVVLGTRYASLDVVILDGADRSRVADVRLADGAEVVPAEACGSAAYVTVDGVAASGELTRDGIEALRLTNPDATQPARVRPVLLALEVPSPFHSQQPVAVVPLGPAVDVGAGATVDVALASAVLRKVRAVPRWAFVSLKSYAVPVGGAGCG